MKDTIPHSKIRQIFLILIILFLGTIVFWQLRQFISVFLASYTLYILLRKWHIGLVEKRKWRPAVAASLLIAFSITAIIIPVNILLRIVGSRIIPLLKSYPQILVFLEEKLHEIEQKYQIQILTPENLKSATEWVGNELQNMATATVNGALGVVLTFFVLFFLLTAYEKVDHGLSKVLPVNRNNTDFLQQQLNSLVVSNAIGIPLVALVQAIAGLIMYLILGIPDAFLWFLATFVVSMLPVLGSMLVYIPLSILLFTHGLIKESIIMLTYGILVIGSVDNLFRFMLQKWIGDTHPLVTLFGVFAGISLFGFIGLIFGPILISLFLLFFNIYQKEYINH
jgi:predicted PurR-regulated permease PerM